MKLLIVSGLSGAGKTIALHSLEDLGVYCVDNLPVTLLPAFAEHARQLSTVGVAVGVDARTTALQDMPALLETLNRIHIPYEILFLEADNTVLLKRFSETRRKHPLTSPHVPLFEAIKQERQLLEPLAQRADIRIDTSLTHIHKLRDLIRQHINVCTTQNLSILFQSFGFKQGIPSDADFIFDVRCLPNPYWETELRTLTGCDSAVIHFLQAQPKVQHMLADIIHFLETWLPEFIADNRRYLTIAIGCTGGQHRSVYLAEQLSLHFSQHQKGVLVQHRELP
ncbi:MAG: RNase adapter RapZ [Pseudomonadota bacterium]|nr:RNase adapter RapZ [Pseudomonadota bacterium]